MVRVESVPGIVQPQYGLLPAGHKFPTRDFRDRVTIQPGDAYSGGFAEMDMGIDVSQQKYSTLSALKQGRLAAERRDTQQKTDQQMLNKALNEMVKRQTHESLAKKKVKNRLQSSRSQVHISQEELDPRNPTLNYIADPQINTQTKLFLKRKQDFLKDMKKCEEIYANHKNAEQRLNHREECFMRVNAREPKIVEKQREEFEPKVKYGIHDSPLPKFSENNKEWWTAQNGYNKNPKEVSQLKLMHKIMKKNPRDIYLFQDKSNSKPIKIVHTLSRKPSDIPEKPNNVKKVYKGKSLKKSKSTKRWTEEELFHARKKDRLFHYIPELLPTKSDTEPLYSSFNPRGVFRAPPSSKEALQRQLEKDKKDHNVQGTNHSQNNEVQETAHHILDTGRPSFFKRVKTAYGKRRNNNLDMNNLFSEFFNQQDTQKEQVTFRACSQVGFRTSAFATK